MSRFTKGPPKREFIIELEKLEAQLRDLKNQYERHFSDPNTSAPTHLDNSVSQKLRALSAKPGKRSQDRFRLNSLSQKYKTYKAYWDRTLRARNTGTFARDIFREALKKTHELEDLLKKLYETYCEAHEIYTIEQPALTEDGFNERVKRKLQSIGAEGVESELDYRIVNRDGVIDVEIIKDPESS